MTITMYGIKNCDTIKKAKKWLQQHEIEFSFHDFRADGLDKKQLSAWCKQVGWETLLNKRGTTWRQLDEATKSNIDATNAIALMLENPAIIKRPVLVVNDSINVGFSEAEYEKLLS